MRLKHELRKAIQRFGIDVVRYPLSNPLARTVRLLHFHRVDCVLDVGANDGGFATAIRKLGYSGRIISFEPLRVPYASLSRKAEADGKWESLQCAVGDTEGEVTINVSGNSGLSSSLLPMLERHSQVTPSSRYVGTENIRLERLDTLLPQLGIDAANRIFLKIDVQGYEQAVLNGSGKLLAGNAIRGMQLELSLIPLYGGAMDYRAAFDRADALGMTLMGLDPVLSDSDSGQLLQVDAVFFR